MASVIVPIRLERVLLSSTRIQHLLAATFVLIYCSASAVTVDNTVGPWGDDWAQYLMHARALAAGQAYSHIDYVWSVDSFIIGPPVYPPGTAFILAPIFYIFGFSLSAAKWSMIICFGGFLLFYYSYLCIMSTRLIAWCSLVFVAITPVFWWQTQNIGSENPFLLICYCGLLLNSLRNRIQHPLGTIALSISLGSVAGLAYATREVGIILLLAITLPDLIEWRKWLTRSLPILAAFLLVGGFLHQFTKPAETYSAIIFSMLGSQIVGNVWQLFNGFRSYAYLGGHIDALSVLPLLAACLAGACQTLKPAWNASAGSGSVRGRLAMSLQLIPEHMIFVFGNIILLLLLPFSQGPRYLIPFMPILLWYAVMGAHRWIQSSYHPRFLSIILIMSVGCLIGFTFFLDDHRGSTMAGPTSPAAQDLFMAVTRLVPEDQIVAFAKPRVLALFSGRKSIGWPTERPWKNFVSDRHIHYLAISNRLALPSEDKIRFDQLRDLYEVIFWNADFALYKSTSEL